jgi:hypothetical protein
MPQHPSGSVTLVVGGVRRGAHCNSTWQKSRFLSDAKEDTLHAPS